jgi:hypothetical protein
MALGKGRSLVIDGVPLRWTEASRSERGATRKETLFLLIQRVGGPGQRLAIVLPWGSEVFENPVKPVARPLLPGFVARCARAAIERNGWRPEAPGPELVVSFADVLPGEEWPATSRELRGRAT